MQLASQLYAAGISVFPCYANKCPAVRKGEDWNIYAQRPPEENAWPSPVIGVPVPLGAVVIDLDTYKGVTREHVEQLVGCALPWDMAMIQTTMHGGQHYAFSVDWPVIQNSDIAGIRGLDTRVGGKGYVCTGEGYTPLAFGVFAFAFPGSLPRLPDACRAVFEQVFHVPAQTTLPVGDKDVDSIVEALRHIDPGCGRGTWLKIGLALRHQFHDDEQTGYAIFDQWSSGELWPDGCPHNYVSERMYSDFMSFKPEGGITIATLFYIAIAAGWQPPAGIDTALAFGAGAASVEIFNALVTRIHESGTDIGQTVAIVEAIHNSGCNALQRDLLSLALKAALKSEGVLDKKISDRLDSLTRIDGKIPGMYGKNHTENALQFVATHYPDGSLVRSDQLWYAYNGKAWEEAPDDDVSHQLMLDMLPSAPQDSVINGTYSILTKLVHINKRCGADIPGNLILFDNGVLDLYTGQLLPHSPEYFTTNILPYCYDPTKLANQWLAFLYEVFEGDQERVDLLQEWFGYMLSSSYIHHKVLFLLGPARSGKGTVGRVLEHVVGTQNFSGGSLLAFNSDPFMDSLRNKPVMFIGDAAKRINRFAIDNVIERLKSISGDDKVIFARKYKPTMSTTLPTRVAVAANQIPNLFDDSGALASRMMVLPFDVSFLGREDTLLTGRLLTEIEGIGAWSLQGLARLSANGRFTMPQASQVETHNIAEAYSPLNEFIEETCTLGGDNVVSSADIYDAYLKWAIGNREDNVLMRRPFTSAFTSAVRGKGCKYGRHRLADAVKQFRGYKGLTLRQEGTAAAFTPAQVIQLNPRKDEP